MANLEEELMRIDPDRAYTSIVRSGTSGGGEGKNIAGLKRVREIIGNIKIVKEELKRFEKQATSPDLDKLRSEAEEAHRAKYPADHKRGAELEAAINLLDGKIAELDPRGNYTARYNGRPAAEGFKAVAKTAKDCYALLDKRKSSVTELNGVKKRLAASWELILAEFRKKALKK
jgi:hypothetical protein